MEQPINNSIPSDNERGRDITGDTGAENSGVYADPAAPATQESAARRGWSPPEPTVLTLKDLLALPSQILPEQTYTHLMNAGKEAMLACKSLISSINSSRMRDTGKTYKRIDVE